MSWVNTYSITEIETIVHLFRSASLLPPKLAALTRITTQSTSQILTKMEKDNVIKRTPSKDDKRKLYISLSSLEKNGR